MNWLKQLFCKHNWKEVTYCLSNSKILIIKYCSKCGKAKTENFKGEVRKSNRRRHNSNIKYSF